MTIAKRLSILLAVPLLILIRIGVITRQQLAGVEERARFAAVSRVAALARLGDISRSFAEMRVNVRSALLATSPSVQAAEREDYSRHRSDLTRLLDDYADNRIATERGRRLVNDFRTMSREWMAGAEQVMSLAAAGRKDEANALLSGSVAVLGEKLSGVLNDWIRQNEGDATAADRVALDSIERARQNLLIAVLVALALSGTLGFFTFRKIVHPIRSLRSSVESIAGGEFANTVPFTTSIDETGDLARSIDVLKHGAAAMEEQRWVKANQARLTADLPGAASLAEFGERFVSGLVPVLGGGEAGFYVLENRTGCLRRIASYGLTPGESSGESFRPGEGLIGQCARERKPVSLTDLPPDYLRIASGLGGATPVHAVAWPVMSQDALLGVLEFASFRALSANETLLLEELLPVVAMSLEILQRNLRSRELLDQVRIS